MQNLKPIPKDGPWRGLYLRQRTFAIRSGRTPLSPYTWWRRQLAARQTPQPEQPTTTDE